MAGMDDPEERAHQPGQNICQLLDEFGLSPGLSLLSVAGCRVIYAYSPYSPICSRSALVAGLEALDGGLKGRGVAYPLKKQIWWVGAVA